VPGSEHGLHIVKAIQANRQIVAMSGDDVNNARPEKGGRCG
jgi:hypothetical protein